ncbi:hypothetical protein DFH08DRAFT_1028573 [Mycena albidolilacea]|uniref:DUF6534 domain-containing protein n=1 Tax=Mycena albidolilacea TaxID=1033008 RepID=A0AAD6ZJA0_9AGAR|nr:hypothetical protein DFH08DRAFT_1028573 [Mycena albidolilacea]
MSFHADIVIGALLVGTWANSVLYTVEVIQAARYYRHFKHDNWMLKLLVSSAIAIDSVSMIANYASVYLYTITHWGDLAYIQNQYWASQFDFDPLYLFATGVVAALVQSFLASRYWLLTRNKFITLTLFVFITVATGGAFACGVTIATFPGYTNRRKAIIPATTWLITEAVTDISIASALLWEFWKAKSSFKETRSLLNRLVAKTIQTGTAGASIALAVLIAFLANKESNVPTGIAYTLGRVYCITMLSNLNSRKIEKSWSGGGASSGGNLETRGERGNQGWSEGGDEYGDIHAHRTAVVHIDTPKEYLKNPFKSNFQPGQDLPDDSPTVDIEMAVNDSASYSSKKKQDL